MCGARLIWGNTRSIIGEQRKLQIECPNALWAQGYAASLRMGHFRRFPKRDVVGSKRQFRRLAIYGLTCLELLSMDPSPLVLAWRLYNCSRHRFIKKKSSLLKLGRKCRNLFALLDPFKMAFLRLRHIIREWVVYRAAWLRMLLLCKL